jgi:hypothetical protein
MDLPDASGICAGRVGSPRTPGPMATSAAHRARSDHRWRSGSNRQGNDAPSHARARPAAGSNACQAPRTQPRALAYVQGQRGPGSPETRVAIRTSPDGRTAGRRIIQSLRRLDRPAEGGGRAAPTSQEKPRNAQRTPRPPSSLEGAWVARGVSWGFVGDGAVRPPSPRRSSPRRRAAHVGARSPASHAPPIGACCPLALYAARIVSTCACTVFACVVRVGVAPAPLRA